MYWFMKEENQIGSVTNRKNGTVVKVAYRSRFPNDDTYVLLDEKNRVICFLWLGEIVDPNEDREYFLED